MALGGWGSYSSYNANRPTALKKKATPKLSIRVGPSTSSRPPLPKSTAPALVKPKAPAPVAVAPTAPAPVQAVPQQAPFTVGSAPQQLTTASDRTSINEGYGLGVADINRNILDAAMRYGGAGSVTQYGLNGNTSLNVGNNDNSALSAIQRNEVAGTQNIDEGANADNTFFSSRRLTDLQKNNDEAARQRAQAKMDYDKAMGDYASSAIGLRTQRDTGLRNADIADLMAAQAIAPTNQIPQELPPAEEAAADPAPTAAVHAAPKAGYQFVQKVGTRTGMSYNLVRRADGTYWRRYENGDFIPRS